MNLLKKKTPKVESSNLMRPVIAYQKVFFSMDFVLGGRPRFLFWDPRFPESESLTMNGLLGPASSSIPLSKRYSDSIPNRGSVIIELACSGTVLDDGETVFADRTRVLQILLNECSHAECKEAPIFLENSITLGILPTTKCERHSAPSSMSLLPYANRSFMDAYDDRISMGFTKTSKIKFEGVEIIMEEFTPTLLNSNEFQESSLDNENESLNTSSEE